MADAQLTFMQAAFALAEEAKLAGEVPIGAVVVYQGQIIGHGYNQPISQVDPTAHAEILAMCAAAKQLNNYRLVDCDVYVTLQPCPMCAAAMVHARIANCYFGATDSRDPPSPNHQVHNHGGMLEQECATILKDFFKQRR